MAAGRGEQSDWVVVVLTLLCTMTTQGFVRFTFGVVIPDMTDDLLGSYSVAGALGFVNLGAYFVGVLVVMRISQRVAAKTLMKGGMFGSAAGLGLIAVGPDVVSVFAGATLSGFASAFVFVSGMGLVASAVAPHRRGFALGLASSGIGMGVAIAGRIAALHPEPTGWRWVWGTEAVIAGTVAVLLVLFLHASVRPGAGGPTPGLAVMRRVPGIVALFTSYAAVGVSYSIYTTYLVAALEDDAGFSDGHAALSFSLVGLASIAGGVVVGRASDRFGRRASLAGASLVMAGCALLVLVGLEPWVTGSAVFFGITLTGTGTAVFAYVGDKVSPAEAGTAVAGITLAIGLGQLVGAPLGGLLADATGSFSATYVTSALTALGAAVAAVLLPGGGRPVGPVSSGRLEAAP
ncbi:MAG: MFS transporter [Acidimicrobiia bacterium]